MFPIIVNQRQMNEVVENEDVKSKYKKDVRYSCKPD